ncbi:hypothetical protein QTP88_017395 [Uroleucon formosanum]
MYTYNDYNVSSHTDTHPIISASFLPTEITDIEDLIIEAIYSKVISGELDQQGGYLEVDWTIGRDVGSNDIDNMISYCYRTKEDALKHHTAVNNTIACMKTEMRIQVQKEAHEWLISLIPKKMLKEENLAELNLE